jgi:hypothetical protein
MIAAAATKDRTTTRMKNAAGHHHQGKTARAAYRSHKAWAAMMPRTRPVAR